MKKFIIAFLLIPISVATWLLLEVLQFNLDIRSIVLVVMFLVSSFLFTFGLIEIVRDSRRC